MFFDECVSKLASCCQGSHGQETRDWLRKHVFSKTWWHVGIAIFFTLIHDVAGLISASTTVIARIQGGPFDSTFVKVMTIYFPIILFDCGSEIALVMYHDLPLCRGKFKNGPTDRDKLIVRIALVGQILTAISWASLFGLVVYFSVFTSCPTENADELAHCKFLVPGLTEAIVIFIVFLNNSMTLKEYNDRVWVYPIICREELLYLSHIITKQEARVLDSFSTFHGLKDGEVGCMDGPEFNVGFNYFLLMCFDLASLASVSTLIMVHNATPQETFWRALPFAIILIVDISSETMILVYHDLPLLRAEHETPKKNKTIFDAARFMQVFVNFAWLGSLIYMFLGSGSSQLCGRVYLS